MPDNVFLSPSYYDGFMAGNNMHVDNNELSSLYQQIRNENMYLQQRTWNREDTAYQRMVEDMKAAGLNPWTGINTGGSPTSASAGSPSMDAFKALMTGYQFNQDALKNEMKHTDTLINNAFKLLNTSLGSLFDVVGKL